ncbi:hypothetical protein M2428_000601 [Arthrobacter sp. ES3-54]|nr:hypothetical protein [Arthrobacter sp. ES3-54]
MGAIGGMSFGENVVGLITEIILEMIYGWFG